MIVSLYIMFVTCACLFCESGGRVVSNCRIVLLVLIISVYDCVIWSRPSCVIEAAGKMNLNCTILHSGGIYISKINKQAVTYFIKSGAYNNVFAKGVAFNILS